jgi:hypothetical protein
LFFISQIMSAETLPTTSSTDFDLWAAQVAAGMRDTLEDILDSDPSMVAPTTTPPVYSVHDHADDLPTTVAPMEVYRGVAPVPRPRDDREGTAGRRTVPIRTVAVLGYVADTAVAVDRDFPNGGQIEVFDKGSGDWHPGFGVKTGGYRREMDHRRRPRTTIYEDAGFWDPHG